MGTQLGDSLFQEQDVISSWLDLDDEFFQQELHDLENHLFNLDQTDRISSSSLPIPLEGSPFILDHHLQPNIHNNHHQPILPVEQCVEPDVRNTILNDYEFELISPTDDLSPDINNNINDQFCKTMISGLMNPVGDVEIITEPVITTANATESKKTDDEDGTDDEDRPKQGALNSKNKTDDEDGTDDEDRPKQGALNSKNMVSERNRRKRLSKQLLSLRALVPNITKMDKRSVLVDALSYLRKIHEETEMLQKEIKEVHLTGRPKLTNFRESSETFGILSTAPTSASVAVLATKSKAQITEIDTEKIEDKRFIVKITCKGGVGVGSDVFRVFECLDYEITYAALQQLQPQQVLATIYIRVRKQWKMTEKKLKHSITNMALRIGLSLPNPNP